VVVGKEDPLGTGRAPQDRGKALASASTHNRMRLSSALGPAAHQRRGRGSRSARGAPENRSCDP
jgi:hypothetical protein